MIEARASIIAVIATWNGSAAAAIPYPRVSGALFSGLLALDPASVIMLGLSAFALEWDWRYVPVTAMLPAMD